MRYDSPAFATNCSSVTVFHRQQQESKHDHNLNCNPAGSLFRHRFNLRTTDQQQSIRVATLFVSELVGKGPESAVWPEAKEDKPATSGCVVKVQSFLDSKSSSGAQDFKSRYLSCPGILRIQQQESLATAAKQTPHPAKLPVLPHLILPTLSRISHCEALHPAFRFPDGRR